MNRMDIEQLFAAFAAKDLAAVMAYFADEAVVFDPHYPAPLMNGKTAIQAGFEWAFMGLQQPGFTIDNFWGSDNNAAIEVDTHHIIAGGQELRFPQLFVVEWRAGLITRLQSYTPYPPPLPPATA